VLYYSLLKHGSAYVEIGQTAYEQKYQQRRLNSIQKQALAMGYHLIPAA
jgi:transposase